MYKKVVEIKIKMELMIDSHLLLSVTINTNTIGQLVKEIYLGSVVVVIQVVVTPLLEVTEEEVEIDEWMIGEEQMMMNIRYLIMLKTVVIEVKIENLLIFYAFVWMVVL